MKSPSVKQSLVYGTTTAIGAAAGLGILVLTARVALPLFQKLGITPQSWLTRSAFIATGGAIGLATPWVASITYRPTTTTITPISDEETKALEATAPPKPTDRNGWTPLHAAAEKGEDDIVKQLIEAGVDLSARDEFGQTPLHIAALEGHANVAALLIDAKANLNATDRFGQTPLHGAALNGHANVVKLLIDAEANLNVVDGLANTPLVLATRREHADIVQLLEEAITAAEASGQG